MTYRQAVEFLDSLVDFERLGFHRHFADVVGLDAAHSLLEILGEPHLATPAVHIAGTKGKGSTAALVERVLREAGYRTGLFTSPHLVSFHERVRINGRPIDEQTVTDLVTRVRPAVMQVRETAGLTPCTFFETYMAMAVVQFAHENVDIAVYETGLGGRLDATNLVTPLVSAVTTIGFDHMAILGDTLDAIAREKAEIGKPGVPLVVARNQPQGAIRAIEQVAAKNGAPVRLAPEVSRREPPLKAVAREDGTFERPMDAFDAGGANILPCPLVGAHQAPNIGVALGILNELIRQGYTVSAEQMARGLEEVRWPGRFDVRRARPWLVFDCAHNAPSAAALARALPEYLDYDRLAVVVGMSEDKDIAGFARALAPLGATVILTRAAIDRALAPEDLAQRADGAWDRAEIVADSAAAVTRAMQHAGRAGAVCVTGSFYVVGEVMAGMGLGEG